MPGQNIYQPAEFKPMVNWVYDVLLWLFSGTRYMGFGEGDQDANTVCLGG